MQIGFLVARFESQVATLTKRAAEVEAALQAKRAALTTKREKAYKSAQALKVAIALVSSKDDELEKAA